MKHRGYRGPALDRQSAEPEAVKAFGLDEEQRKRLIILERVEG